MAIDRAPWNALIDDDGSNLVGTVWNKDTIKTVILDPVDVALGTWVTAPFLASDWASNTGSWAVTSAGTDAYCVVGKTLFFEIYVTGTITGTPVILTRKMYTGFTPARQGNSVFVHSLGAGMCIVQPPTSIQFFRDFNGTAWPAGGIGIRIQGFTSIL